MKKSSENDNALLRSYWTDADMMPATGAASLVVIKAMQKELLLQPGTYKNTSGQNARAWSLPELLRVALVVDLSAETGFNLPVSVLIASMLGEPAIDRVLGAGSLAQAVAEAVKEAREHPHLKGNRVFKPPSRPDIIRLAILDRRYVYELKRASVDDHFRSSCIGVLDDTTSVPPVVTKIVKRAPAYPGEDMADQRSNLVIKLANLARSPLHAISSLLQKI